MTEHPALLTAARHGLFPQAPSRIMGSDAGAVLDAARLDHLTGFVAKAVDAGDIAVEDSGVRDLIIEKCREELLACVVLESLLVRTADRLEAAGVTWRLTKGAGLAHLDYPSSSMRTFGDIDLVIHPEHWDLALQVLTAGGARRVNRGLGTDYEKLYGKGVTLATQDDLELDLHLRFCTGRFAASARMTDVFEHHSEIVLAGRSIPVLDGPFRLLHACHHASLGGFTRFRALRDIAQLILVSEVDWELTFEAARRWRALPVVGSAIISAWERLEVPFDHPARVAAESVSPGILDRWALRVFREERAFRVQALTAVGRLPIAKTPHYLWSVSRNRRRESLR